MGHVTALKTRMFALLVIWGLGAAFAPTPGHAQGAQEKVAADIANDIVNRRFDAIVTRFTPELEKALSASAMEGAWNQLMAQGGAVQEVGTARIASTPAPGVTWVIVPFRLERTALDMRVTIAGDKVAGLFFLPAQLSPGTWNAPGYVDPTKFTNADVAVGPLALGGTLTLPKGVNKAPVVVLIHGSGPNDRDESIGPNRPFRDIAEGLASRGIAALRYDKRTKVRPGQFSATGTVREETMDDAVAAVALLAARSEIDARRIVIVGHSLGGMLAPRIADGRSDIAGIVIMAGATRPLPEVAVEQAEYVASLNGPLDEVMRRRVDAVKREAARAAAAKADNVGVIVMGAPSSYWADLNAYDPAAAAARSTLPLLVLQGGRDFRVTLADLKRYRSALDGHRNATIREFPRLNHLFMDGEGKSRPEEYDKAGHVDVAVIEALPAFVNGLR